jgi:hypothetical protein
MLSTIAAGVSPEHCDWLTLHQDDAGIIAQT